MSAVTQSRKLYIRNLDFNVVPEDLVQEFSKFGKILACDVPRDQLKEGKCKGYTHTYFKLI